LRCKREDKNSSNAAITCGVVAAGDTKRELNLSYLHLRPSFPMIRLRPRAIVVSLTVLISLGLTWHIMSLHPSNSIFDTHAEAMVAGLPPSAYNWTSPRPAWLDPPSGDFEPTKFRLAIITHPSEVSRRKVLRETVLSHLPRKEVVVDYRFFMGLTNKGGDVDGVPMSAEQMNEMVKVENTKHGDIKLLDVIEDKDRLAEKRYQALQWVRSSYLYIRDEWSYTHTLASYREEKHPC
jgi:hypothetical protein